MKRACRTVVALTFWCLIGTQAAFAGTDWVEFQDETAARLNPSIPINDVFGKDDVEEKDYAWGDVDQDGDIDLIVVRKVIGSNSGAKRNRLFMNENGVLVDRTDDYATAATDGGSGFNDLTPDRDVALVDVNLDGWLDIVTASAGAYSGGPKTITHPRIYINLKNDGGGNWLGFRYEEARIPTLVSTPNFCGIGFGDIDGPIADNGPPDLYFTDYSNGLEDRLLINTGTGSFVDETTTRFAGNSAFLGSTFSVHAVMADLNGDGFNDIIKNSALGPYNLKLASNGPSAPGDFTASRSENLCACADYFVAVGDLNNDGLLDLVEADDGADRYFLNQGNGADGLPNFVSFTFANSSSGFDNNTVLADLDMDGFLDVLVADVDVDAPSCANRLDIHHNLGNPPNVTFVEDTANLPTAVGGPLRGTHDIAVFDINGDSWPDLVIGTCNGTTIWINQPPFNLTFSYPQGLPELASLDGSTEIELQLDAVGDTLDPTSPTLHVSINGGAFTPIAMSPGAPGIFTASLPAANCLDDVDFYVSAELSGGQSFTDPPTAPGSRYSVVAALGMQVTISEQFEGDVSGWTVTSDVTLTNGEWEQADPNGTISGGNLASPEDDATPGALNVKAFVTQNGPPGGTAGADDVDGGRATLMSPVINLAGTDAIISYSRWFFSDSLPNDQLVIDISNDDGANWTRVELVSSTFSQWQDASFVVGDYVTPTANVRVRFVVSDDPNDSITEAGIDNFVVNAFICPSNCPTDVNGDGTTNVLDLIDLLLCFGLAAVPGCQPEDINSDGTVNVLDLIDLLLEFGNACP